MSIQQLCVPQSVYGKFSQYNFLGCSIKSFDVTAGWNEQISELVVELYQDPCAGNSRTYLDGNLYIQTTTAADPGFVGDSYPIIGCPVYFRQNDFEFAGIVQSWEKMNSLSGYPSYRVRITDPREILEASKLIISDYDGGLGGCYNLFNVFGWTEQFGNPCPHIYLETLDPADKPDPDKYHLGDAGVDLAMFGSDSGGFGGSLVNPNGMQWNRMKTALAVLTGAYPKISNVYSPYGRLMFYGTNYSGYGTCGYDRTDVLGPFSGHSGYLSEYILDLSELPNPGNYFRINGNNVSVLDAINQVCDICSYDYYIELLVIRNVSAFIAPSGIAKIIKVRAVSRATQPVVGSIQSFIGSGIGAIATSVGRELRNETTSSFLIGGNKQTVYQIEQNEDPEGDGDPTPAQADDIILPYFGVDIDGDALIPEKDASGKWFFYAPLDGINGKLRLIKPLVSVGNANVDYDSIKITETELQCALMGYDQWLSYTMSQDLAGTIITELGKSIDATGKVPGLAGVFNNNKIVQGAAAIFGNPALTIQDMQMKAADLIKTPPPFNNASKITKQAEFEDLQEIYDWVYQFANTFYGTYFQVRLPYTCVKMDTSSGHVVTSEEASDGGWTEQAEVIQLTNGWFYDNNSILRNYIQKFQLEDGRTGPFVRYDYNFTTEMKLGLSEIDEDSYQLLDNGNGSSSLWLKAEVEKDFVYLDRDTYFSPRAVVKVVYPIRKKFTQSLESAAFLFYWIDEFSKSNPTTAADLKTKIAEALKNASGQLAEIPLTYEYVMPDAAAIPIKSNVNTYGPWVSLGPAGNVRVDQDPGLVPWEYAGIANLNIAATALVTNGLSLSQIEEMGEVTVPGYPEIPLSAEIGALGGGFYTGGTNLMENRSAAVGSFSETNYAGTVVNYSYCYFSYGSIWVGTFGPHITNINVQVGTDGVQTRYQFRTFTKKFGNMQKLNAERIREGGKIRLEAERNLRLNLEQKEKREGYYGKAAGLDRVKRDRKGVAEHTRTPSNVLVGQILNWKHYGDDCRRPEVSLEKMTDLPSECMNKFDEKAFMSLDGLVRPISMDGGGNLPRYVTHTTACQYTQPIGAQPPVYDNGSLEYDIAINTDYLNPMSNPPGYNRSTLNSRCDSYLAHDMEILGRGTSGSIEDTLVMPIEGVSDTYKSDYYDDYRLFALRGPLLLTSWGYDLDGFPVPNKADSYYNTTQGEFVETGLQCKFMDGWLKKPETWVTAPVDLRFDRKRGVWVSPQAYRLVRAQLEADLCYNSSALARVLESPTEGLWDCEGNEITEPKIVIHDVTSNCCCIPSGNVVLAYYHPEKCEYWLLEHDNHLLIADIEDCTGTGVDDGSKDTCPTSFSCARSLTFGSGITLTQCSGLTNCDYRIDVKPLYVAGCSGNPAYVSQLSFSDFVVDAPTGCENTKTATISLNVFDSDCIDMQKTACGITAVLKTGIIVANDNCIQVLPSGTCKYRIGLASGLVSAKNECIEVTQTGCKYEIGLGSGIVSAGTCISVTQNGCKYTVSLDTGSAKTTVRALCDVDLDLQCVTGSGGTWQLQSTLTKYYTEFSIPSCMVSDYSAEC